MFAATRPKTTLGFLVLTFFLHMGCATAPAPNNSPLPRELWWQAYLSDESGQVGYHFDSVFKMHPNRPPGLRGCPSGIGEVTVAGALPPGLTLIQDTEGPVRISGTPRQPGRWNVRITIGLVRCMTGPDQSDYGPISWNQWLIITP